MYNTLSCFLLFTSSTSILLPSQILFLFFCHTIPFFYGWMLPVYFNTQRPIHGLCPLHLLHLVDLQQFMYPLLIIQLFDCGSCRLIHMVPIPATPKPVCRYYCQPICLTYPIVSISTCFPSLNSMECLSLHGPPCSIPTFAFLVFARWLNIGARLYIPNFWVLCV